MHDLFSVNPSKMYFFHLKNKNSKLRTQDLHIFSTGILRSSYDGSSAFGLTELLLKLVSFDLAKLLFRVALDISIFA